MRGLLVSLIGLLVVHGLSNPASASLGGDLESVRKDAAHVGGSLKVTESRWYSICEIKVSTQTVVREFVSPTGTVFGIAWEGPFVPELQQFLGPHFQEYSYALHARKSTILGRRPLELRLGDLVFENSGHVGAFFGRAYVPQVVPPEVAITEVH